MVCLPNLLLGRLFAHIQHVVKVYKLECVRQKRQYNGVDAGGQALDVPPRLCPLRIPSHSSIHTPPQTV
eukprot:scaffold6466_cov390-Prasinococcus_capsulatus_cf.AAC.2